MARQAAKKTTEAPAAKPSEDKVAENVQAQEAAGTATTEENEAATTAAQEGVVQPRQGGPVVPDAHDREGFGRVEPDSTIQPRRYAEGTGYEAGNRAPSDLYVDEDGNVSKSQPGGRGRLLAAKGSVVTPAAARLIAEAKK